MALITEDGSGVKDANAYGTVAEFKTYFADRPEDVTAISDATIALLLVAATRYVETTWGHFFKGLRQFPVGLDSRAVLTLTAQPANDETVVFGTNTYTFKTTANESVETEVEIGSTTRDSLLNLLDAIATVDSDDYQGNFQTDPDTTAVVVYATNDGTTTTETLANGSWDQSTTYGKSFKRQPLEFPRKNAHSDEGRLFSGVPDELRFAIYEYAFRQNTAALAPDPAIDSTGRPLKSTERVVGPIKTKDEYLDSSNIVITKPYPVADRLLRELVTTGGGAVRA